jgi:hypothetical protein
MEAGGCSLGSGLLCHHARNVQAYKNNPVNKNTLLCGPKFVKSHLVRLLNTAKDDIMESSKPISVRMFRGAAATRVFRFARNVQAIKNNPANKTYAPL